MWFVFALGSAVFAALTSILAKIGIQGVNSTLATAIRTVVVLVMSWGMVFLTGTQTGIGSRTVQTATDNEGRIETAFRKYAGNETGRRRFAMCTGNGQHPAVAQHKIVQPLWT